MVYNVPERSEPFILPMKMNRTLYGTPLPLTPESGFPTAYTTLSCEESPEIDISLLLKKLLRHLHHIMTPQVFGDSLIIRLICRSFI